MPKNRNNNIERWITGELPQEVSDFWTTLKNMNNIELSELISFLRISTVKLGSNNINVIETEVINKYFLQSQIQNQDRYNKGTFGIQDFSLDVAGRANSLYKGNLSIKIFDPKLLETKNNKIVELFQLGVNLRIEFGWSKYDWGPEKDNTIKSNLYKGGKGHKLYGKVSGLDISADSEGNIDVNLSITAMPHTFMNDKKIHDIVEIKWDELKDKITGNEGFLGFFRTKYISLKDLFDYIYQQFQNNAKIVNNTIPKLQLSEEVNDLSKPNNSDAKFKEGGNTVGDFMVDTNEVDNILSSVKTFRGFINKICSMINDSYMDNINLELIATPNSEELVISDQGNVIKNDTKSRSNKITVKNLSEKKDKYLHLDFASKNTLLKDFSFESDMNDGTKKMQVRTDIQGIKGATNSELKQFMTTWFISEDEYKNLSEQKKNEIKNKIVDTDKEKLLKKDIYQNTAINKKIDSKEEIRKFYEDVKNIIVNREINNHHIKYLPYTMSCTIIGISDIWKGTRIYLDDKFMIPQAKETVWRVTDVNHSLNDNNWEVELECELEWRKSTAELRNKIDKAMKNVINDINL